MFKSRISLVHPTGNPNSRNAALALWEAGLLHEVITTIAYDSQKNGLPYLNWLPQPVKARLTEELGRRNWAVPEGAVLRSHPWQELLRIASVRSGISRRLGLGQQGAIAWVYASLDRHVANHHLQEVKAVYAYEDGAATTFQAAKERNVLCLYELPILFYRVSHAIQAEEAQRFPELAIGLQAAQEPTWKIDRKEQEVKLADHIFVPSLMVKQSLLSADVKPEKISVISYGAPIGYFQPQPKPDQLFRTLFVGRVGPRKGVHYLLQAWQELHLPKAELLLVGVNEFPSRWLASYEDTFNYVPSVPHASLNDYYSRASVLVLPSLVEGFALVLLEAMACGIPIITTSSTAGPEIITDGVEGFIIPIRDVEVLKQKLEWCYRHPQELAVMGRAARRKAEQLTWERYRQQLGNQVKELMK